MTADTANLPEPRKLALLVCKAAFIKQTQRVSAYYTRQNSANVVVTTCNNGNNSVAQFLSTFRNKYTGKACCWFCDVYIHYIGSGVDVTCTQQSPLAVKLDACTLDLWNVVCMEVCRYQRPLLVLDCTSSADIARRLEQSMAASFARNLPLVLSPNWQLTTPPPATHSSPAHPHPEHVGALSRMVARQKPFQQWFAHHAIVTGATNATFKPKDDSDVLRLLSVALCAGCAYIRATNTAPAAPDAGPTVLFTKTSHLKHGPRSPTTAAPPLPRHQLGASPFVVHRMHAARAASDQRLPALELYRDWVAAGRELVTFLHNSIASFNQAVTRLKVQASQDDLATPATRAAFTARFAHAAPVLSRLPTLLLALAYPPAAPLAPHAFTAFTTTLLRLLGLPDCLPLALAPLASLDLRRLLALAPLASLDLDRRLLAPPRLAAPGQPPASPAPTALLPLALCLLCWLDPLPTFDLLANISHVPHSILHFVLAFVHGAVPLDQVLTHVAGLPGADRVRSILQHVYKRRLVLAELTRNLDTAQRAALAGVLPYHVVPDGIPVCQYGNLVGHYKRAVRHALQQRAAAVATGGDGAA